MTDASNSGNGGTPLALSSIFDQRLYVAQTLDPVHVGTGEFQLGRVDNIIVREPGTHLPKIPGTSIAGAVRAYVGMRFKDKYDCAGKGDGIGPDAAGAKHCGKSDCPVCMTFGYSKPKRSFQGLAQFSDARLLFFPVYTLRGPMWATSPFTLESAGIGFGTTAAALNAQLVNGHRVWVAEPANVERLNAGWLYLPVGNKAITDVTAATAWTLPGKSLWANELAAICSRVLILDDQIFSLVVDDQLEVRTSVSIDPTTGAAADGALFTTEAIPRGTFLYFHVTAMNPSYFQNPGQQTPKEGKIEFGASKIHEHVDLGFELLEYLGLGGSNTRGLGRMRVRAVAQ
jgi:CRISPR-associated protein Cmr4